ncbi:MAG TPA: methyltransferase domain-containing protein [Rudaea sp.]|nr:methyltransferase domain-containing protein [Rudaea sp.]
MRALFARELRALGPILERTFGNFGLLLSPCVDAREILPGHKLGTLVQVRPIRTGILEGDARCMDTELPFASDSINAVIAQHAFEHNVAVEENVAELARILAPEGLAMIFGFNPLSTWRPWLELHRRRSDVPLRLRSAHAWRKLLLREYIDTVQVSFPGVLLPRAQLPDSCRDDASPRGAQLGSSWLLLARKRRSALTPLRQPARTRDVALRPRLVPGTQRDCA